MRRFLFKLTFARAHKAMKLGSSFPVPDLQCYLSEKYFPEEAQSKGRAHAVIGIRKYTYWLQPNDRDPSWASWSTNSADDFIKKFHHEKIHGELAIYPLIITQIIHGKLFIDYALKGQQNIFEEKKKAIEDKIAELLERHLNSFSHRFVCLCLRLAR